MIYANGECFEFSDSEIICKHGDPESGCRKNGYFVLYKRKEDGKPWATLTYLPNSFGSLKQDVAVSYDSIKMARETEKNFLIDACNEAIKKYYELY